MTRNIWKILFILLLVINVIIIGAVVFWWASLDQESGSSETEPQTSEEEEFQPYFTGETNSAQVNNILEAEMENERADLVVEDGQFKIISALELLGREIDIELSFVPEALENGNVELQKDDFSIAGLPLPGPEVLTVVQNQTEFPEFVQINPEEETIRIRLDQWSEDEEYTVRAERVNLEEDEIVFVVGR
ncbi:YpmS family protein [Marinococcus halotolerans]|uniref:YpmS family protein n=1 Tax=Marinococcus halotolerans TaxID=301092 RepID=UPI0003B4F439|nr:YpmS family protein [Marinococcus halotolerans]